MDLSKIERPKICEEGLVDEIVIDAEVEGVGTGLGWVAVTDPIQPIWYDLKGLILHII